jgi:HSP20 family protein
MFRPVEVRPVRAPVQANGAAPVTPARVDVVDHGDRFAVKVDLPGVSKDDINLTVDGARVSVEATARASEQGPEQITVLRAERRGSKYGRTLELPAEVDAEAAQASFENGVLSLTLPKRVQVKQIVVR